MDDLIWIKVHELIRGRFLSNDRFFFPWRIGRFLEFKNRRNDRLNTIDKLHEHVQWQTDDNNGDLTAYYLN